MKPSTENAKLKVWRKKQPVWDSLSYRLSRAQRSPRKPNPTSTRTRNRFQKAKGYLCLKSANIQSLGFPNSLDETLPSGKCLKSGTRNSSPIHAERFSEVPLKPLLDRSFSGLDYAKIRTAPQQSSDSAPWASSYSAVNWTVLATGRVMRTRQ